MKIVFRYLTSALLKPLIFCVLSFFLLWIIHDLFDILGDLMQRKPELSLMIRYYLVQIPKISQQVLPVSYFFAVLYVLTNFSASRELIALQAAGISLTRISVPFYVLGAIIAITQYFLYIDLAPNARKSSDAIRDVIEGRPPSEDTFSTVVYHNPETFTTWYLESVDLKNKSFSQGEILISDPGGRDRIKYFAAAGTFKNGLWNLARVRKVEFIPGEAASPAIDIDYMDAPFLKETPAELVAAMRTPQELPWPELHQFINTRNPHAAIRMAPFRTEYYFRILYPLISTVLCAFAFSLGITIARQARRAALFWCLLVLFGMLIFMKLSVAFGNGNILPPMVAAGSGIFLFGLVGLYLFAWKVGWLWDLADLTKMRSVHRKSKKIDLNKVMGEPPPLP
jgi:lipopolysaccharide export system permease protein